MGECLLIGILETSRTARGMGAIAVMRRTCFGWIPDRAAYVTSARIGGVLSGLDESAARPLLTGMRAQMNFRDRDARDGRRVSFCQAR